MWRPFSFFIGDALAREQGVSLNTAAPTALVDQLASALNKKWLRARDLFHEWDANGDGEIDRKELHRAMNALGIVLTGTTSYDSKA